MPKLFASAFGAVAACIVAISACGAVDEPTTDSSEPIEGGATAIFAGGCFWCVESDFEKLDGVGDVISGYTGGLSDNPTYKAHEGHVEAVKVPYDPSVISYRQLVDYHLRHIDPLDEGGQFCDRGHSYTTAIYVENPDEFAAAEAGIAEAERILGQKIVTPIVDRTAFWKAEDYHQDYAKKNPLRYKFYRGSCGRDARVKKIWGDAD